MLWNIEYLLILIGQPAKSAAGAAIYVKYYLPGVVASNQLEILRRFLNVQGVYYLLMNVQMFGFFIHLGFLYFFVSYLDLTIYGVAIASSLTNIIMLLAVLITVTFQKGIIKQRSWHCFNSDSFEGLCEYLHYGVPSVIMGMLENISGNLLIFMAGLIDIDNQGACIIIFNFDALTYMIALGISSAGSNLVGNCLGANQPNRARSYAFAGVYFSTILGILT